MNKSHLAIIKYLLKQPADNRLDFDRQKRQICNHLRLPAPDNTTLLKVYHQLVKNQKNKTNPLILRWLKKREVRTLSGVAPIAVLTKPYPCPGHCLYCPGEKGMPKSYLSNEPAVMRAVLTKFDPHTQVKVRLQALKQNGHHTDKCELIVMGGTWSYLPKNYQTWFIKRCFDAFNGRTAKTLAQAQEWNEKALHRCIGLTLETRPDYINPTEVRRWRELGATRVELGVQHLDDKILKLNHRGHGVKETVAATKLFKQAGFKITYHLMPNLPGSTPTKDLAVFKKLFTSPDFQPDQIKIYPCVVTKDAPLFKLYKRGKYQPYSDKQLRDLLVKIKKIIPPYVRITRLIRDIPAESIVGGNKISNLRQLLAADPRTKCRCIRCREIKNTKFKIQNSKFKIQKYPASDGTEYFLSYELAKPDKLLAFLRLRLPNKNETNFLPELQGAALIREIHTYGQMIPVGEKSVAAQHLGLGKKLILRAEKLALKNSFKKIAVIAGIGVRPYYAKLGYQPCGTYYCKQLTTR
ncbi:MAG: tRNA uridine(34) 5-carboxymethylaminomethyl modification radical SAM/GNAT enzyme Elp3 [Patescibacteria group bacterium]